MSFQNNTTHAIVQDGAEIYSGADGGFSIKAEEGRFVVNLTQAGASGGKYAIGGSVAYAEQVSDTLAQLGHTAVVTGRDVVLYAGSLVTQANWVGGVVKGENVGVGIAVAINRVDRKTRALIGDADVLESSDNPLGENTSIDVTGEVKAKAVVSGDLWAFTVAGTAVTGSTPDAPVDAGNTTNAPDSGANDTLNSSSLPDEFNDETAPEFSQQSTGIGIAAAVSINIVQDETQASIVNAGTVDAGGDVSLISENDFFHFALTGGAAFALGSGSGQSSNALARALSFNNLDISTRAFIVDTNVTSMNVGADAKRTGDLITASIGAAGNASGSGRTVAGSISINQLENTTEAYLDGTTADAAGTGTFSAYDESGIFAIGGGAAIGGGTGAGFSIGFNQINGTTRASINDSTVEFGGALSLTAKNDNTLRSVGVSAGIGKDTGVAFTLGINLIGNSITAEITDSTLTEAASITLRAQDDSNLSAVGGALGIGFNGTGFGGALGWNSVINTISARIENSNLTGIDGAVSVRANSTESDLGLDGKITSAAIGAAGSSENAVGGALAINGIINRVDAHISANSTVSAGGDVTVEATDTSTIWSLTGGAALSNGGNGVGIAISANFITNDVTAYIDSSNVTTTGIGSILITADEAGTIESVAVGLSAATGNAVAGSLTTNVIVNTVAASILGSTTAAAAGNLRVKATNSAHIGTIAGQISVSTRRPSVPRSPMQPL